MEKILFLVWKPERQGAPEFRAALLENAAPELTRAGCRGLQLNLADEAVEPASLYRMANTKPPPEGLISLWVDSVPVEYEERAEIVARHCARFAAYLVTESEPLRNTLHPAPQGERTPGYSQIALLQHPPRMQHEEWRRVWQHEHGPLAIETQSTFRYVQNLVVRALSYGAPGYHAIVEECFPAAAMTDPQVFYDAAGDEKKHRHNEKRMMESCARFIDFAAIDCIPTSEYVLRAP